MKAKLTICLYVALLPSIIYGEKSIAKCSEDVIEIAKRGGEIQGVFQPTEEKPLSISEFGFVFKGIFLPNPIEIAMKFSRPFNQFNAEREYEMYTYLNATGDANVEQYGIPSVYFYGTWDKNNLTMLGISVLEHKIDQMSKWSVFQQDVNVLIVLRNFILSSKYMHSHGVRHDNIMLKNMMTRKHQSFLIDFSSSSKMKTWSTAVSNNFASRRAHNIGERYPKDDWESFLYSICFALGADFAWIGHYSRHMLPLKSKTKDTIEKIKKIKSETLKNIFVKFAEHVFDDGVQGESSRSASQSKRIPDYDGFYDLVNKEIDRLKLSELKLSELEPAVFTWLSTSNKEKAIKDLNEKGIPKIADIKDPNEIDFSKMKYPDVDYKKFTRAYKDQIAKSV